MNLTDARILVVDDEPLLLELFELWLHTAGCGEVFTACDGEAALRLLEHQSIDLLVTDIRMPVMDGLTLVRRLAELGSTPPSIVFVSGFGDVDRREMYALGVEAFIAKPFDRLELLEVMERAVAERSTLWHAEMTADPRQSVVIEASRMDATAGPEAIGLGRGGFTVCSSEPLSPGKIAFRIRLTGSATEIAGLEISGQGYVRWYSRNEGKAGIEFAFLDPRCCAAVAGAIAAASPRSFIPAS